MRRIYRRVAGLDVHKKTVVATRMRVTGDDRLEWETKTFGTTTPELLELHDWLSEWGCTHVSMESTGDYPSLRQGRLEAGVQPAGRCV